MHGLPRIPAWVKSLGYRRALSRDRAFSGVDAIPATRTDGRTQNDSIYRASIASRGKNHADSQRKSSCWTKCSWRPRAICSHDVPTCTTVATWLYGYRYLYDSGIYFIHVQFVLHGARQILKHALLTRTPNSSVHEHAAGFIIYLSSVGPREIPIRISKSNLR